MGQKPVDQRGQAIADKALHGGAVGFGQPHRPQHPVHHGMDVRHGIDQRPIEIEDHRDG